MGQNFIACDRGQELLLPPSLLDWVPEDHLVWTVLGAVEQMDLSGFYGSYRANGQGRAAYDPAMMVALLMYAYSRGNRSSRGIERECREDVVYKLITAMEVPDHSTIAEFRKRHEVALAGLFTSVLKLCREAGLVSVGVIAIDGSRVEANASHQRTVDYRRLAEQILAEADRVDREEDELYGDRRGDELPEHLQTVAGRRAALQEAKRRLEQQRCQDAGEPAEEGAEDPGSGLVLRFDDEVVERASGRGRRRWFVEARQQLDEHRRREARPIPRDRAGRLLEIERRFREQLACELEANRAYEEYIAGGVRPSGKRFRAVPAPFVVPEEPEGKINTTDPDARMMQTWQTWVLGYNAQAAVNENHIVVAAEVSVSAADFGQLEPMVTAVERELTQAGVSDRPEVVVADAGYWHQQQMQQLAGRGIPAIVPPDSARDRKRTGWTGGQYEFMRNVIKSPLGQRLYRRRQALVEPVFGDIKHNRSVSRFQRRGRAAAQSEWRLVAATHNLLKLHNHWIATSPV